MLPRPQGLSQAIPTVLSQSLSGWAITGFYIFFILEVRDFMVETSSILKFRNNGFPIPRETVIRDFTPYKPSGMTF
jgi:hypothetical protein